jgi:hypothetical protein
MFNSLTERAEWIEQHPDQAPPGIIPFASADSLYYWMMYGDYAARHDYDPDDPQHRTTITDGPVCVLVADQLTGDDLYPVQAQVVLNEDRIECVAMERIKCL